MKFFVFISVLHLFLLVSNADTMYGVEKQFNSKKLLNALNNFGNKRVWNKELQETYEPKCPKLWCCYCTKEILRV